MKSAVVATRRRCGRRRSQRRGAFCGRRPSTRRNLRRRRRPMLLRIENDRRLRVFHVIPGEPGGTSMVFSKRDVEHIRKAGVCTKTFFLKSRTHPVILLTEWLRLRRELKAFRPHIVHAHYGTVTALVTVLTARAPTV